MAKLPGGGAARAVRRILFVGDSLTYCNDLDKVVAKIADKAGEHGVVVDCSVKGGAPLKELWSKTDAQQRIAEGKYDVVVLQEDLPETKVEAFHKYAVLFHQKASAAGCEAVLLMTWAYKNKDWISMDGIADAHWDVAHKLGVKVAPAGLAWKRAEEQHPGIKLRQKDGEHPTLCGTYLMAAVVFATLWGRSPVGTKYPASGALQPPTMELLQQAAWETVRSCRSFGATAEALQKQPSDSRRESLVSEVFRKLDRDGDAHLTCAEMLAFADFMRFQGGADAWEREFAALCAEVGCAPGGGMPVEGFQHLVDSGSRSEAFCTDCTVEDLHELLEALRLPCPAPSASRPSKVVIVPGNGCRKVRKSNWYGWLADELGQRNVPVGMKNMPDPDLARESVWLPFIVDTLAGGQAQLPQTIVVGHSSGAAAAMRLAEKYRLGGVVLVAAYTSDLGDPGERASGYFSRAWDWEKQKANCGFIVQFASRDDPFLPFETQSEVGDGLAPLIEFKDLGNRSHFFHAPFPELLDVLVQKLGHA